MKNSGLIDRLRDFCQPGKASFVCGGQWGSEGKGASAAWIGAQIDKHLDRTFDIVTTNAGAQAGHTSDHDGTKRIVFHLPTLPLVTRGSKKPLIYLNAGSIIDPIVLEQELRDQGDAIGGFCIHPNATVITDECREAEGAKDSAQTKISSTRKGVGEALSRKVLRSGQIAKDHAYLREFVTRLDLNDLMWRNKNSILVEVPQGFGLGVNQRFYPYCTSRECTVMQGMSDAHIHPDFMGQTMLTLRTFPIRVGSLEGTTSGGYYGGQRELTWDELGVKPEITTVTGRVRRVFSWSLPQVAEALAASRPSIVFLTHCDYVHAANWIDRVISDMISSQPQDMPIPLFVLTDGPTTDDWKIWEQ